MQGVRGRSTLDSLPYGGIGRVRFLGTISTPAFRPKYPRC